MSHSTLARAHDVLVRAAAVLVPTIAADSEIKRLSAARDAQQLRLAELLAEFKIARALGGDDPKQAQRAAELQAESNELRFEAGCTERSLQEARRRARNAAGRDLMKDNDFRQLYVAAARYWAEQLAPYLALADARDGAAVQGIPVPAIPPALAEQVRQYRSWLVDLQRAGIEVGP